MPNNLHPKKGKNETVKAGSSNVFLRVYERFVKIRGQPREIALGFALGIFIGMTATMRIQTPILFSRIKMGLLPFSNKLEQQAFCYKLIVIDPCFTDHPCNR